MSQDTPVASQSYRGAHEDEIDLFELFQSIWQEKILIIVIAGCVTLCALAYALIATPVYQAQTSLVPPPFFAVQNYNNGRIETLHSNSQDDKQKTRESTVKIFSAEDIYKVYLNNLKSLQLRNEFFDSVYTKTLSAEEQKSPRDILLEKFNKILTVKQADAKTDPDAYLVVVELSDPTVAVDWIKQYLERAETATKLELKRNIETEQKVRISALSSQVKALLDIAKAEREDQINLLQEALYIAESIGLESPSSLSDKASLGGSRYIDNDLIYTRGAKTLRAQLDVLKKRSSDVPFITGFRELSTELEFLKAYQLDDSNVSVVRIDEAAEVPSSPIKPKKSLIVAVGFVLGGMLGVFAALIRSMIRKRKNTL